MTTIPMVTEYIKQLCKEIGINADDIYSAKAESWYFTKGSVNLQVSFSSYTTVKQTVRTFIRVYSPVYAIPTSVDKKLFLYEELLSANRRFLGMKFCTFPDDGQIYVFGERDIEGMDYNEFYTLINDTASWADQMDDLLVEKFGATTTKSN